ncbi:MAG: hypothetical protein ABI203_07020 [Mucilaginibacter sp.]
MIAYNKTWIANLRLREKLNEDVLNGLITAEEFKQITEKYEVGFYTPSLFARVGLFILTGVVILFGAGLLALVLGNSISNAGFPIFLGFLTYGALEFMVNTNNHYRSGVDDALLFISGCLLTGGFAMLFSDYSAGFNYLLISEIILALSLFFTLRFADMLTSAVCCLSLFSVIFFAWTKIPSGLSTVPFIMMLASAGAYWLCYKNRAKFVHYEKSFVIGQIVCLVILYSAGNFYIIQTLSDELHGQAQAVPFGLFFWTWTILLPFVYVSFGVRKKDGILLRVGLLLVIAAAITFRNYYHLLPLDVTLTLVGALLLGIAYAVIRYLKTPKHGFTYTELNNKHFMDAIKIESLIIAETFSTPSSAPADKGVKFGGGDFGGGGSDGAF